MPSELVSVVLFTSVWSTVNGAAGVEVVNSGPGWRPPPALDACPMTAGHERKGFSTRWKPSMYL